MATSRHMAVQLNPIGAEFPVPLSSSSSTSSDGINRRRSFGSRSYKQFIPLFVRRLTKFRQMDFEMALWQMSWLLISPRKVYKNVYYHKLTKNHWSRDDPAFVVLLSLGLAVMSFFYSMAYHMSFWGTIRSMFYMVFVDFLLIGLVVATAGWYFGNRYLIDNNLVHSVKQTIEWAYCFDIHCNSFFPVFLITYLLQFFFLSIVTADGFISRMVGNLMYLIAFLYYNYITFLGYSALPFVQRSVLILFPSAIAFVLFIVSLFTVNISKILLQIYFA